MTSAASRSASHLLGTGEYHRGPPAVGSVLELAVDHLQRLAPGRRVLEVVADENAQHDDVGL